MSKENQIHDPLNVDEALSTSEAFLLKYKNLFVGIIVAIVVIACGILAYNHFIGEPKELKASEALFKGEQYFGNDDFESALNGDSLGYAGFLKIANEYSGTDAGNLANAYCGLCYAQMGKYEEAVTYLDKFNADDYMVAPAILGTLGNCYAQMGQLDKAADMLLKAAKEADNNTLSPIYLQQAGEILVKQGKYDQAIEAYTTIKDKYFRSYQAMQIDKFIEEAKLMKK